MAKRISKKKIKHSKHKDKSKQEKLTNENEDLNVNKIAEKMLNEITK